MNSTPTYDEFKKRDAQLENADPDPNPGEQASKKQQALLRMMERITRIGGWEYEAATRQISWTDGVYEIYGVSKTDHNPSDVTQDIEFYHPEDRKIISEAFSRAVENGEPYDLELRFRSADGMDKWVRTIGLPEVTRGGVVRVFGNIIDITARKQAEEILSERTKQLDDILEKAADGICVCHNTPEAPFVSFTHWNPRMTEITGYTIEEINRLGWYQALYPDPEMQQSAVDRMTRMRDGDDILSEEWIITDKHGHKKPLIISTSVLKKEEDRIHVLAVMHDISDRKRMEENLKESETRLKALSEAPFEAIFLSKKGVCFDQNRAAEKMFGYTREEAVGRHCTEWIVPENREQVKNNMQLGYEKPYEVTALRKDGTTFPCEIQARMIDDDGRDVRVSAVRDLTERKQAESEIREREERFRTLVEQSPLGISLIGKDGRYQYVNPQFEAMFGYTIKDVPTGEDWFKKAFPKKDDRFSAIQIWIDDQKEAGVGQARPRVFTVTCKDGSKKEIHFRPVTLENFDQLIIYEDITERRRAEAALRESEKKYKTIIETIEDGYFEVDLAGNFTFFNDAMCHILGYPKDELLGMNNRAYMDVENAKKVFNTFNQVYKTGMPYKAFDWELIKKDGTRCCVETSVTLKKTSDGRSIGFQGIARDITERKQAEQQLQQQNQFIQTILDNLPIGLAVNFIDEGTATYINKKFEEIYGWPKTELENIEGFFNKVYPDKAYREKIKAQVMEDIQSGDPERMAWEGMEATGQNGKKKIVFAQNIPLYEQNLMISTVQDITESRNLQAQLQQSQKMESVGRLAGGVAHDFNNMLGVIIGHTEIAMEQVGPASPLRADLEEIQKAAQRSADLTRQLLAFARRQTARPRVLNLNDTVTGMLKMLRRLIGEDIALTWMPGANLWPVKIDPAQIDQILANLCVNARDAIAGVGNVSIKTQNVNLDKDYCAEHPECAPGDYVMLSISDTGCGMDKETLKNLFEPFFTTKEVGTGTGLGLATIYGIVKQNEGFIYVYSEPGQGTTFKIYFPRTLETEKPRERPASKEIANGTETVLLVEDEASILDLGKAVLEKFGYTVLAARTPGKALAMAEQYESPIHLLVTDVVMPEMNGNDLKFEVEKFKPGIKVLFMSGYTSDIIMHRGILEEDVNFLQKPFSVHTLAGKVREVLDQEVRPGIGQRGKSG